MQNRRLPEQTTVGRIEFGPRHPTADEQRILHKALLASAKIVPDPIIEAYAAAVEQMLAHEDAGGDGWWKGWEMLKAAHRKAGHNV